VLVVAAVLLFAAACSDSADSSGARHDLVTSVSVHAAPHSAHVPIVTVKTSQAASVTVTATSGDHRVVTPASTVGTTHEVPVLGLRTDRDYRMSITAESRDGVVHRSTTTAHFTTPPLPKDFPELKLTSERTRVSPGITLIPIISGASGALKDPSAGRVPSKLATGRVIGVDETGQVVWYYQTKLEVVSVAPTTHGTLLLGIDDDNVHNFDASVREIDMLGNTVGEWSTKIADREGKALGAEPGDSATRVSVDIDSVHHDVHELPNGHLIALSTELIEVGGQKGRELCPTDPVRYIVGDVVVEFERSGKVVGRWPVSAAIDPAQQPGSDMCKPNTSAPSDWMYPGVTDERDWTHANAVVLDAAHNTLIVSLRHLDAVIGLRYRADGHGPAGALEWELGPHGDLAMQGAGLYQYHQHAAKLRSDGSLILFDNGNLRPGTTDGGGTTPTFSRAAIFEIDPAARTVRQVWQHRDDNPWGQPTFVPFMGDADPLPNGDVLITYALVADMDRQPLRPYVRLVEVDPDIAGGGAGDKVVFDLLVGGDTGPGWVAYHAQRVPSLYFGS
jgi:hypothetical protein